MPDSPRATTKARLRAKKACKACNARRVRCDVTDGQPCTNCRSAEVPCELIASKRGKYDRRARKASLKAADAAANELPVNKTLEAEAGTAQQDPEVFSYTYTASDKPSHAQSRPVVDEQSPSIARMFAHDTPNTTTSISSSVPADSTVFLGESSSISVVHGRRDFNVANQADPADKSKLRYPIPDGIHATGATAPYESKRKAARLEQLQQDGAFTFPSDQICEVLLDEYFRWFHPCFPCLHRTKFCQDYLAKAVSPLLLHAVLFIGSTHCKEEYLESIGVPIRQQFRSTLYHRAKDLYDADYETDKTIVTQAVFLISFWRDGPLLEKDTRHWLGAAISLAQSQGMHRSLPNTMVVDRQLKKRIWWCLYIRDRQCAAALGLPTRIRDEDCDIELLTESDFDTDVDTAPLLHYLGTPKREHSLYICHMAKLAILLGKIVLREFSPGTSPYTNTDRATLRRDLEVWVAELPKEMSYSSTQGSFWAGVLHIAHNNLHILLYRSEYLKDLDDAHSQLVLSAACNVTQILEHMLAENQCGNGNLHMITSLFNSLCIHTIHLRRCESSARKLAEDRAHLCLLGLRELQKTWDVSNWVLQLFFQFLEQSTAQKLKRVYGDRDAETPGPSEALTATTRLIGGHVPSAAASPIYETPANMTANVYSNLATPMNFFRDPDNGSYFDTSYIFGTREAEDFSMFQLQPDLFHGDLFGGGLDQYYSSIFPRDGMGDGHGMNR